MKILTGIVAFYFLVIAAANIYFVSVVQGSMAVADQFTGTFAAQFAAGVLWLEHPLVWLLNKVPFLYVGNMAAFTDITMRSSMIVLCASVLLLLGCVILIHKEE